MASSFNIAQLAAFKGRLAGMAIRAAAAVKPSIEASAAELVEEMQRLVPKDSGRLAESIVATSEGEATPESALGATRVVPEGSVVITAGNREAFWADFVEYGTSKAHAQPFFNPAIRAQQPKIGIGLKKAVARALTS